jgi:hypothetical protein
MLVGSPQLRTRLTPSRDVLTGEIDGTLVVLDLRTERYYLFDAVATTMWRLLLELGDRERVVAALAERYDAGADVLGRDLDALIARLLDGGFVRRETAAQDARSDAPAVAAPPGRLRARPSVPRAWWWLARTALRMHREGFTATYRAAAALAAHPVAPGASAVLEPALRAFARAENAFVFRNAPRDCFPRSVALFCFLRELGIPVEHRIGVNRHPFRAHAYVVLDGRVLSDHPGQQRAFTTLARISA